MATSPNHRADRRRACARLDADFAAPRLGAGGVYPSMSRVLDRAVLMPDLADFAADRDRHPGGFAVADEAGQGRTKLEIFLLLVMELSEGKIDESGGIDVDVVEPLGDGFDDHVADGLDLGFGVDRVFFGPGLEVVALDEDGPAVSFPEGGREDGGDVLGRSLVRVDHLAPGDLEDKGAAVVRPGGPEHGPGGIVGQHPQVHCRNSEGFLDLAAAPGDIQLMDRGGTDAGGLGGLPDQPPGGGLDVRVAEYRFLDQAVHCFRESFFIEEGDAGFFDVHDAFQRFRHAVPNLIGHDRLLETAPGFPGVESPRLYQNGPGPGIFILVLPGTIDLLGQNGHNSKDFRTALLFSARAVAETVAMIHDR